MTADSTRIRDTSAPPTQVGGRATRAARIRKIALLVILAELVVFGAAFAIFGQNVVNGLFSGPEIGTDLGSDAAPAFALRDQTGRTVGLTDFRGKVVVLTFLYTSCPDTCPVIASRLGVVHDQLGGGAQDVALAAVAVDPERDTVERGRQFLEAQGVGDKLLFLTADRPLSRCGQPTTSG